MRLAAPVTKITGLSTISTYLKHLLPKSKLECYTAHDSASITKPMSHNPLEKIIEQRLLEGHLTFPEFMNLALYHPHYGYYSGREQKFGAQGDFITAPELSPLFSQCLADQCVEIFQQLQEPKILEVGAGSGVMAKDLLLHLESIDQLPDAYLILEVSGDLRQRQQKLLQQHCPQLINFALCK